MRDVLYQVVFAGDEFIEVWAFSPREAQILACAERIQASKSDKVKLILAYHENSVLKVYDPQF